MSSIFSFIVSFCVCGILIGALYVLLPHGAMKKSAKYILCLCFLCSVLSFLPHSFDFDLSGFKTEIADYSGNADIKAAELTVKSALKSAGVDYSALYITPQKDENQKITELYVEVHTKSDYKTVKEALNSENIKVSVINE